jgi:hypothetical protein
VNDIRFLNHQLFHSESQIQYDIINDVLFPNIIVAALEMEGSAETAPCDIRILGVIRRLSRRSFQAITINEN